METQAQIVKFFISLFKWQDNAYKYSAIFQKKEGSHPSRQKQIKNNAKNKIPG